MAKVISVNISKKRGTVKKAISEGKVKKNFGIEGDAHGGDWNRQISLLASESIDKMRKMGIDGLIPGAFAENITTKGLELHTLPINTLLKIGEVILKVTQIGKICHKNCDIYKKVGSCIMPLEGIFAIVVQEGKIKQGDEIEVVDRICAGIIIASDKAFFGEREDKVIPVIKEVVKDSICIQEEKILPDEREMLAKEIKRMADDSGVDLIITSGGTGFSPRDVTPEATLDVIDRNVPGIAEYIRQCSLRYTLNAVLSRGVTGIRKKTLIINMPGSPKAVEQCLQCIIPVLSHGIKTLRGEAYECGSD